MAIDFSKYWKNFYDWLKMLFKILIWYFVPAAFTLLAAFISILIIYNHLKNYFCDTQLPLFDFTFLIKDSLVRFHTVGIYASLIAQIAVANFYSANGYFDAVKLKNFFLESIGVCLPVFTTCAVMVSTISVHDHHIQEWSNWIYLFLIIIWDTIYTYFVKGNQTDIKFKRCTKFTKGLLGWDAIYLLLFVIVYFFSKSQSSQDGFLAGGYSIIFCVIVLNLVKEIYKWQRIEANNEQDD